MADQFRREFDEARREYRDVRSSLSLGEEEEDPISQMRREPSSLEGGSGSGFSLQWEDKAVRRRLKSLSFLKDAGVENLQVFRHGSTRCLPRCRAVPLRSKGGHAICHPT